MNNTPQQSSEREWYFKFFTFFFFKYFCCIVKKAAPLVELRQDNYNPTRYHKVDEHVIGDPKYQIFYRQCVK